MCVCDAVCRYFLLVTILLEIVEILTQFVNVLDAAPDIDSNLLLVQTAAFSLNL